MYSRRRSCMRCKAVLDDTMGVISHGCPVRRDPGRYPATAPTGQPPPRAMPQIVAFDNDGLLGDHIHRSPAR